MTAPDRLNRKPGRWLPLGIAVLLGATLACILFSRPKVIPDLPDVEATAQTLVETQNLQTTVQAQVAIQATQIAEQATRLAEQIPLPTIVIPTIVIPTVAIPPLGENLKTVSFQGVQFEYARSLASEVAAENVPAETEPDFLASPDHILFTFVQYPLTGTFHKPQIRVYPVGAFESLNPNAEGTIAGLQQLLSNWPAIPDQLPFLPVFNAAQFIQAQVAYLEFQNGSGVRFLTQYGQAAWPINNDDLFYTFQGLSQDGEFYVSAILPVSHPSLPAPETVTLDDAFYDNFPDYLNGVELLLNNFPPESFNPNLNTLDKVIQSLVISGPE